VTSAPRFPPANCCHTLALAAHTHRDTR